MNQIFGLRTDARMVQRADEPMNLMILEARYERDIRDHEVQSTGIEPKGIRQPVESILTIQFTDS